MFQRLFKMFRDFSNSNAAPCISAEKYQNYL